MPSKRLRVLYVLGSAALAGSIGGVALERFSAARHPPAPLSEEALDRVVPPSPAIRGNPRHLASAESLTGLPPYPGARPQDLAADVTALGVPMHVAWFSTPDSPADVVHFYEEKLAKDRKLMVSHLYSENAGYVGYLEMPGEKMHVVSVLRQGQETLVFPSESEMGQSASATTAVPNTLPRPERGEGSLVLTFKDNGVVQDTVFENVPDGDLDQVLASYQRGFKDKGWTVGPPNRSSPDAVRLEAKRDRTTATVVLRRQAAPHPGVAVYLTLTTV
jgi:hypothetical protein